MSNPHGECNDCEPANDEPEPQTPCKMLKIERLVWFDTDKPIRRGEWRQLQHRARRQSKRLSALRRQGRI